MKTIIRTGYLFIFLILPIYHCYAQWIQTDVPTGFSVSDMETYEDKLYAVVGFKVISINEDKKSFELLADRFGLQYALAGNNEYLFSGNTTSLAFSPASILRSSKGDTSWVKFETGLPSSNIYSLTTDGGLIAAGGVFGVYLSSDNGVNWNRMLNYPGFGYFFTPILMSEGITLVGGGS